MIRYRLTPLGEHALAMEPTIGYRLTPRAERLLEARSRAPLPPLVPPRAVASRPQVVSFVEPTAAEYAAACERRRP